MGSQLYIELYYDFHPYLAYLCKIEISFDSSHDGSQNMKNVNILCGMQEGTRDTPTNLGLRKYFGTSIQVEYHGFAILDLHGKVKTHMYVNPKKGSSLLLLETQYEDFWLLANIKGKNYGLTLVFIIISFLDMQGRVQRRSV